MKRAVLSCGLALFATASPAAPRIESIAVKPNPAAFGAAKPPQVEISVTIERPTPLELTCEAQVDPGDGSPPQALSYGVGDRRTKRLRHLYYKTGTYKITVAGAGRQACEGRRELTLVVRPAGSRSDAAGTHAADPKCPSGWSLVPESVNGARYSCRPNLPAQALKCAGGTTYFADEGLIGCK